MAATATRRPKEETEGGEAAAKNEDGSPTEVSGKPETMEKRQHRPAKQQ